MNQYEPVHGGTLLCGLLSGDMVHWMNMLKEIERSVLKNIEVLLLMFVATSKAFPLLRLQLGLGH